MAHKFETTQLKMRTWSYVDKKEWSGGMWLYEADKMQWSDDKTGLPCLIVRGPVGGLCGYVGIPEAHAWYGVDYSNCVETCGEDWCAHTPECILDAHGGITFAGVGHQDKKNPEQGIWRVFEENEIAIEQSIWWFGFDCAHAGDFSPRYPNHFLSDNYNDAYRNVDYVVNNIVSLAEQLEKVGV